ncbi:hypothetical protein B0H13DRAFT_2027673 [Mycena leptocephala]|nr:hypothetical protein B0H13DRAFT_2027673 [Mycena leptocephala]
MTIELPQELIDEILAHLAGDSASLRACSLVCRAWVSSSRRPLFETCTLDDTTVLAFRDFLRAPQGCTFLQHIRNINAARSFWNPNDHAFDEVAADLRRLTGVRTLELALDVQTTVAASMDAYLTAGFVAAFPHVTRLECVFHGSRRPPAPLVAMLCLFPALQVLHIREVFGTLQDPPASAVPPRGLHSLQLSMPATGPILAWLHTFNHLPNVNSLELAQLKHTDVPVVHAALQQARGAIRHLNINLTYLLGAPSHLMFDLSLHPNLRTLSVYHYDTGDYDPTRFMVFIKTLAAPALELLSFELFPLLPRGIDWPALDAFLCSEIRFPRLRMVLFKCSCHLPREAPDMHDNLREVLPLLGAAGVLKMERL